MRAAQLATKKGRHEAASAVPPGRRPVGNLSGMPGQRTASLEDLELLVGVAETGSLGGAGRRHGLSQPAVSMRMTGLERRVGVQLLERLGSGTRLTEAGGQLVVSARQVLASADAFEAAAALLRVSGGPTLRVAASFTVAEHLLPAWIGSVRASFPAASQVLEVVNSTRVLDAVVAGRADIGFVEGTEDPGPDLRHRLVTDDELAVVVAPDHPWGRRSSPVTGAELATAELVVREVGSGTRQVLERALAPWGGARTRLELGSSEAVLAAVRRGDGAGVLSALVVAAEISSGQVCLVRTAGLDFSRQIRAVWNPVRPLSPMADRLLAVATAGRGDGADGADGASHVGVDLG